MPNEPTIGPSSSIPHPNRSLYTALVTLTLGVLGSTILPVPYAFSKMGLTLGCLTMLIVAFVNDRTCCMLIRAAAYTGHSSYEELAEWAGGKRCKVFTQVSLILLLYGTLCGGLAFLSDVARIMINKGIESPPDLLANDGRPIMLLVVLVVLYPLCLQRHIRQFERAATFGVVVVVALSSLIISKAVATGFPAVASGEFPLFELRLDPHLAEGFAVLGFAFYMQPMLMPLLKEMPVGPVGVKVSETAVHLTLYGTACLAYGTVGIFGAATYGMSTESNIMVNKLFTERSSYLMMYSALLVYLCCGMVTTHYALRASLHLLLFGPHAQFSWIRQVLETSGILMAGVFVALLFPTYAEKIFALTGCTAVCLVCYIIPVFIYLRLYNIQNRKDPDLSAVLLDNAHDSEEVSLQLELKKPVSTGKYMVDMLVPTFIVLVGVGCSVAGIYVSVMDILGTSSSAVKLNPAHGPLLPVGL